MTLDVVQEREDEFAAKLLAQEFRRMRVRPDFFESPKRGRSPAKKKTVTPSTPGPLTLAPPLAWKHPPQETSSEDSSEDDSPQASPQASPQQQQSQRGGRGSARGGKRGGAKGGVRGGRRGGKKAVTKEVVEEPLVFSRSGRPIRPKQW